MGTAKEHIAKKIKELRKNAGLNVDQVGEYLGKSGKTISAWEVGRGQPDSDQLIQLCLLFNADLSDFYKDMPNVNIGDFVDLPVYGSIAAGLPLDMMEIDDVHPCPKVIADQHPNSGWLLVDGESYNRQILNGSYALVDFDLKEPKPNTPFAVCVNGYKATIKGVNQLENGIELVPNSYDPTFLPIVYDYNKDDTEEVTIIGEIVYASLPLDWEF